MTKSATSENPTPAVPKIHLAKIARPPVPEGRPMVPNPGVERFGFAPEVVDPAGPLAYLYNGKYEELDELVRGIQAEFEADPSKEFWARYTYGAFSIDDPAAAALFDEWIAAKPDSFAAHLARAYYRAQKARHSRGAKFTNKTAPERFEAMREELPGARADAEKALELHPNLTMAHHLLMDISLLESNREGIEDAYAGTMKTCPSCVYPRIRRHGTLKRKWSGHPTAADDFAEAELKTIERNPRLAALAGEIAADACEASMAEGAVAAAEKACTAALATFPTARAYYTRSMARRMRGDLSGSHEDLVAAAAQAPWDAEIALWASNTLNSRGDVHGWAEMVLRAARLNPGEEGVAKSASYAPNNVPMMARFHVMRGEREKAEQLCVWLEQLAKDDDRANSECKASLSPDFEPDPAKLAAAQAAKARPTDLQAALALDKTFFEGGKEMWPIIHTWSIYLDAKPRDARAWKERAGTWMHLHSPNNALADLERACQLGQEQACGFASRLKAQIAAQRAR